MQDKLILLNLAPWPTLLSLVRSEPCNWSVWGSLPASVCSRFRKLGIEVRDEALPRPFHRAELPEWVRSSCRGIVVPALGQPLPTRWPIVRRVSSIQEPVYVARHGEIMPVAQIPRTDAFTWALDAGNETSKPESKPSVNFACVRADLLGDLLLTIPALHALAERGSIRLFIREEWTGWMKALFPDEFEVQGLHLAPWGATSFDSAETSIDLSPPDWPSPLTPAIARAIPANKHIRLKGNGSLSEIVALSLGLQVNWPDRKPDTGGYGVFIPTGSSLERMLPDDYWRYAIQCVSKAMNVRSWKILDPDDRYRVESMGGISAFERLTGYQEPSELIELVRGAAILVGVSTALTHLAVLTGTPALVVEHPTTLSRVYRAPVPFIRYIRPSSPWWCDNPSDEDVDRAMTEPANTYGFLPGEWHSAIEHAVTNPPFAGGY